MKPANALPDKTAKAEAIEGGAKLALKIEPGLLKKIDGFIANQPHPQPTRFEAIRKMILIGFETDRDQRRSRKEEAAIARAADAELARSDHAGAKLREDEKTERLRSMRLAKEEHDRRVASGEQKPARRQSEAQIASGQAARAKLRKAVEMPEPPPSRREVAAGRAKELAVGAVKQALANVDAPDEEKLERKRKLVAPPATARIRKPK